MFPVQKKKEASVSTPPDVIRREPDEEKEFDVMEAVAADLLEAIRKHDVQGCAEALRAAFELQDSQPHEEGPHV